MSAIVDMRGHEISSGQPDEESNGNASPNGAAAAVKLSINGLIVVAVCSDGKARLIQLNEQQANSILAFIKSKCGGRVTLDPREIVVQQVIARRAVAESRWRRVLKFCCG